MGGGKDMKEKRLNETMKTKNTKNSNPLHN